MTSPLVVTIIVAIATMAAAIISPITLEDYKRNRDRKLTAFALAASIEGILERTRSYRFVEIARDYLARLERGETVSMKGVLLSGPLNEPIWEKHYDKIGLLGYPLSMETIAFYGYVSALRTDLTRLFEGALDDSPEQMADVLRHGLDIWSRIEPTAHLLAARLNRSAR